MFYFFQLNSHFMTSQKGFLLISWNIIGWVFILFWQHTHESFKLPRFLFFKRKKDKLENYQLAKLVLISCLHALITKDVTISTFPSIKFLGSHNKCGVKQAIQKLLLAIVIFAVMQIIILSSSNVLEFTRHNNLNNNQPACLFSFIMCDLLCHQNSYFPSTLDFESS